MGRCTMKRFIPPLLAALLACGLLLGSVLFVAAQQVSFPFPGRGSFPGHGPGPGPFLVPEPPPPPVVEPNFPLLGGTFHYPARIHLTDTGWLLVTDIKRKALFRVDPITLKADQTLPIKGKPIAVGMLGGEIYVGIEGMKAIEIFSTTGTPMGFLATPGQIGFPTDLAIDMEAGLVFALDGTAGDVKVFDVAERSFLGSIGGGELLLPTGVAVDPGRQEVLVSNYGSASVAASVKVFSYAAGTSGSLVATISGAGDCGWFSCTGGFSRPRGLAVHNARVYLTDVIYGQVLVFDRETLEQVGTLGSDDPALAELQVPSDVEINAQGDVFVTSSMNKSVVVFAGGAQ